MVLEPIPKTQHNFETKVSNNKSKVLEKLANPLSYPNAGKIDVRGGRVSVLNYVCSDPALNHDLQVLLLRAVLSCLLAELAVVQLLDRIRSARMLMS